MMFSKILYILEDIKATSSTNEKMKIIAHNADNSGFVRVVYYALDPYKTFKLTKVLDVEPMNDVFVDDLIFSQLDKFTKVSGVSKEAKINFSALVAGAGMHAVEVVNRILAKDLKCGASTTLFRKAHKVFEKIPHHQPMKGIDNVEKYMRWYVPEELCWSYKLDGTRCAMIVQNGQVLHLSSNGLEIPNFKVFDNYLLEICNKLPDVSKVMFDGEVINASGDFQKHMGQFRRIKEMDNSSFRFLVFDIIIDDNTDLPFSTRYNMLSSERLLGIPAWIRGKTDNPVSYVPHKSLNNANPILLAQKAENAGLEGIMLKTWDFKYVDRRSNNWCKVKNFKSADLKVVGHFEGEGRLAGTLGGLLVDYNGVQVRVGSGYTDTERTAFWNDGKLNLPEVVEVKYQEVTKDGSLRFPVFMRIREDKIER